MSCWLPGVGVGRPSLIASLGCQPPATCRFGLYNWLMKRLRFAIALAASVTLFAQEKPADNSRRLQDTMHFLEQNLPQRISYTVSKRSRYGRGYTPPASRAYELTNVTAEAGSCLLRYHRSVGEMNEDLEIPLQFINDNDIKLRSMDQIEQANHPRLVTTTDPPVFTVRVSSPNVTETFLFTDEATARRVSRALHRAAALCPDYTSEGWR